MALLRDVAGRRYALAIAELARERDAFERWGEAVDVLAALTANPAYVDALQSEAVTDEQLQAIVREVAPDIGQTQLNLIRLLRRKGRLALGPSIASYFRELWDEERGIARAEVRTAVPLDEQRRQQIVRQLARWTGKSVEIEVETDPELLGGVVIRIGDRLIDGSTRGRLRSLRAVLVRGVAAGARA